MKALAVLSFQLVAAVHPAARSESQNTGIPTTAAQASSVTPSLPGRARPTDSATPPVLQFPDPRLDDTAAYRGYQTRFYKDAAGNTVQIYLNQRDSRVVNLWADADDESLGFTVRDRAGQPATLRWSGANAWTGTRGRRRSLQYELRADGPVVYVGWFLLGSMRVERDFQYGARQKASFKGAPFTVPEVDRMLGAFARLDPAVQREHLRLLGASSIAELKARTVPSVELAHDGPMRVTRFTQPSLDARDTLWLEIVTDTRRVSASYTGDSLMLRAASGGPVAFTVRISTTGKALTRLTRQEIFTGAFLDFLAHADTATTRGLWLEREVRGVELLSSREKLMAGLPNYATYFGRDMLMSALMMRSIWRSEMSEFAVASALRKLGPRGDVSHEEALGGQTFREAANDYVRLAGAGDLAGAREVLAGVRRIRENYHMIDDEFQLPVLASRWLADPAVSRERKRAFLLDSSDFGEPRLTRLMRELALVATMTSAYVARPDATNLVSFPARDSTHWQSASWRDSGAGYGGGRYAMDVNAIWAPSALEGIAMILDALPGAGITPDSLARVLPELRAGTPLGTYVRDRATLQGAVESWWGAWRHFIVKLGPAEIRSRVDARLATLPAAERSYWSGVMQASRAGADSLEFLALSLDGNGRPIQVANTDPATGLFLGHDTRVAAGDSTAASRVLRDVRLFVRNYPVGLFVDRVGPMVVNDAYATPDIWHNFDEDLYHGPRVVWGREVNLFLLGVSGAIEAATTNAGASGVLAASPAGARPEYLRELRGALDRVLAAVEGSGFKSELWSYEFRNGRPEPFRYGTGSDVQLWSTTDLAVQYALSRLGIR